jgi:hypothetical protein
MAGRLRWSRVARAGLAALPLLLVSAPSASPSTIPGGIAVEAEDGAGNSSTPGRSCADGGAGAYWHYDYGADLAANAFSKLASTSRVHLDLHSDTQRYQNSDGAYAPGTTAFLQGSESHASILNQRGSVKVRLVSGTCAAPSLAFDGSNASGSGTWLVDSGTGAYRDITGSGTFTLANAEVNPGADNALDLTLDGPFTIPDPSLQLEVVKTYWGGLGTDYLSRRVTVQYRITNAGPGDAFGATLKSTGSPTSGVSPLGPTPQPLFDLPAGASQIVEVRYQLGLIGPCALVLLGCHFQTSATVDLPDGFDVSHVLTATVATTAPTLPPPL